MKARQSATRLFSSLLCAALGGAIFFTPALAGRLYPALVEEVTLSEEYYYYGAIQYSLWQTPNEANGYTALCDEDPVYFAGVSVDGVWRSAGTDYVVSSNYIGSTAVTLTDALIRSLYAGTHTLRLHFDFGDAYAGFTVPHTYAWDPYASGVVYVVPQTHYARSYYDNPQNISLGNVSGIEQVYTEEFNDFESLDDGEEISGDGAGLAGEIAMDQVNETVVEEEMPEDEPPMLTGDEEEDIPDEVGVPQDIVAPTQPPPNMAKTSTQGAVLWVLAPLCALAVVLAKFTRRGDTAASDGRANGSGQRRRRRRHRDY